MRRQLAAVSSIDGAKAALASAQRLKHKVKLFPNFKQRQHLILLQRLRWSTAHSSSSSGRLQKSHASRYLFQPSLIVSSAFSFTTILPCLSLPCRFFSPQAAIDVVTQLEAAARRLRGLHRCKVVDEVMPALSSAAAVVQHVIEQVVSSTLPSLKRNFLTICSRKLSSRNSSVVGLMFSVVEDRWC